MASYCIGDLSRREILKMSAAVAGMGILASARLAWAEALLRRTPAQILGPFYPVTKIWAKTADLTRPREASGRASGQVLHVTGRVLNLAGEPVRDARPTPMAAIGTRATAIRRRSIRTSTGPPCSARTRKAAMVSRPSSQARILPDRTWCDRLTSISR